MDIKQYDRDNLRNILIDYIACARFIKENYEIDKKQRKTISNQVRLANMYVKKLSQTSHDEIRIIQNADELCPGLQNKLDARMEIVESMANVR